jgi:hypothetical protein
MELTDVPIWQWIGAVWLSTWAIVSYRTWSRIAWLLQATYPRHQMLERPFLHMFIYVLCINLLLPIIGVQITLSDNIRDKWVYAYVNALGKNKNK